MHTDRVNMESQDIARAVKVLRGGGVVAFATDTVYGVGANAFLPEAVERLYVAKRRLRNKAIPLLLSGIDDLRQVASHIPEEGYALAERFWPGALTLVLRRTSKVPLIVTAGGETVAVRVPDHPLPQRLIAELGVPLAATSANLSGQPPPVTAEGVLAQLDGRIELILDGGTCPGGVASTVLDLIAGPPRILRQGGLSADEIAAVIGRPLLGSET
jgi:L-threonylcarbamoyladenylate synthase